MRDFKMASITDEKIWRLIYLFFYCSVPTILLVLTITLICGRVNGMKVSDNFILVLCQQSFPILLCYGVIPCVFYKLSEKKSIREIGVCKNRFLWIDMLNGFIAVSFLVYLATAQVFQREEKIWVVHYLFVAVSEEILVRGIILFELKELLKKRWIAVLLSAVIFSLVFHSTDGIWVNMLYRIPFGVITAILYEKTDSLMSSILFHWIYDVLLSV